MLWQADFEQAELSNWHYVLHPQGISIGMPPVKHCGNAAKLTVLGDADYLWKGNPALNRVELQYRPDSVSAGGQTYFSWYFMLPEVLPAQIHQIAYWESDQTYQQIMRLQMYGEQLRFFHTLSNQHIGESVSIEPGVWYQLAMSIKWYDESAHGAVSISLNGAPIVSNAKLKTLVSAQEKAFIQLGMLREKAAKPVTIWLDHVSEVSVPNHLTTHCI